MEARDLGGGNGVPQWRSASFAETPIIVFYMEIPPNSHNFESYFALRPPHREAVERGGEAVQDCGDCSGPEEACGWRI